VPASAVSNGEQNQYKGSQKGGGQGGVQATCSFSLSSKPSCHSTWTLSASGGRKLPSPSSTGYSSCCGWCSPRLPRESTADGARVEAEERRSPRRCMSVWLAEARARRCRRACLAVFGWALATSDAMAAHTPPCLPSLPPKRLDRPSSRYGKPTARRPPTASNSSTRSFSSSCFLA
jgi:hypothetical protein